MVSRIPSVILLAAAVLLTACPMTPPVDSDAGAAQVRDGGVPDASVPDAAEPPDAAMPDAAEPTDAAMPDAAEPTDAAMPDATEPPDAALPDAAELPDAAMPDAAEPPDAAIPNSLLDSDCDGLTDAEELETLHAGDVKTDVNSPDTDGDGLTDGQELGRTTSIVEACNPIAADADPATVTHPVRVDSDGDGLGDTLEDANRNGRVDEGELDPVDANDGAAGSLAGDACGASGVREVVVHTTPGPDLRLTLRPSFTELHTITLDASDRGVIGADPTGNTTLLAWQRTPPEGSTSPITDEAAVRAQLPMGTTALTLQSFATWDGFPAVRAIYSVPGTEELNAKTNALAETLVGTGAGMLMGSSTVIGPFKLHAELVHRSAQSLVVVMAMAPEDASDPSVLAGALGSADDDAVMQCQTLVPGNAPVDFLFVVDDSGSMAAAQARLAVAATAMATRLAASEADWRIAMVTTSYLAPSAFNHQRMRGFTTNINQFRAWLTQNSVCSNEQCTQVTIPAGSPATTCTSNADCWVNINGNGTERPLASAEAAISAMTMGINPDRSLRPDADLVVVLLTDARDQSTGELATYLEYFRGNNPTGGPISVHGIICPPDGPQCGMDEAYTNPRHLDVIQDRGGVAGNVSSSASVQETMAQVVEGTLASVGARLRGPAAAASVRVAVQAVMDPTECPNNHDVPRSRVHGFDVDGRGERIVFHGGCRPVQPGTTRVVASYRGHAITP